MKPISFRGWAMKAAKKVLGDNMGFLERIQRVYIGVQAPKKATDY